jgi:hypothetical protein
LKPLLNRDPSIVKIQDFTAKRLDNRSDSDKEKHKHMLVMSGPGTGKTRIGQFGLEALKASPQEKLNKLANENSIQINTSFTNGTSFEKDDLIAGPDMALGRRILRAYFNVSHSRESKLFHAINKLSSLSISLAMEVVMLDHKHRYPHLAHTDCLIYLLIDDLSGIVSPIERAESVVALVDKVDPKQHQKMVEKKDFLRDMSSLVGNLYAEQTSYFLVTVMTGTIYTTVEEVFQGTHRSFINLPVPLLSQEQSLQLVRSALGDGVADMLDVQLLLCDIGGIPRYIVDTIDLLSDVKKKKGESAIPVEISSTRSTILSRISSRFNFRVDSCIADDICRNVIMRNIISISNAITVPARGQEVSQTVTYRDLENSGLIYFQYINDEEVIVQVPLMLLEVYARCSKEGSSSLTLTLINKLVEALKSYEEWESFVVAYHAMLLTLYDRDADKVKLGNLFRGALMSEAMSNKVINLPRLGPTDYVKVKKLPHRFPELDDSCDVIIEDKVVYHNAGGAKFDGFSVHKGDGKKSELVVISGKYTVKGRTQMYIDAVMKQAVEGEKAVLDMIKANGKNVDVHVDVDVIISNQKLSSTSRKSFANRGTKALTKEEKDFVLVARDEVMPYFGKSFADRVLISSSKYIKNSTPKRSFSTLTRSAARVRVTTKMLLKLVR